MTKPVIERRKHPRVRVNLPVGLYPKDKPFEVIDASLRDISMGGAFIDCPKSFEPGTKLMVELRFAGTRLFEATVKGNPDAPKLPPGVPSSAVIRWGDADGFGIQFESMPEASTEFLRKLIDFFQKREEEALWNNE